MNSKQSRKDRIELLKGLVKGKRLSELLPKVEVTFIEADPGVYTFWVDDVGKMRLIPVSDAAQFIEKVKFENIGKTVECCIIDHAKYLAYSEEFEAEY